MTTNTIVTFLVHDENLIILIEDTCEYFKYDLKCCLLKRTVNNEERVSATDGMMLC